MTRSSASERKLTEVAIPYKIKKEDQVWRGGVGEKGGRGAVPNSITRCGHPGVSFLTQKIFLG